MEQETTYREGLDTLAEHYKSILTLLGEDTSREGLLKTPMRVAKAMQVLTRGYEMDAHKVLTDALFKENYSQMVIVKDIDFFSLCEHHMLPFYGRVHVAYIPNGYITGLSKIARVVDIYSHRLQVQERMTLQIKEAIEQTLKPLGVMVVVEARHMCMQMRGVEKQNSITTTSDFSIMEQFNQNTYKKPNLFQEFYHSCLGKVVILAIIMLIMAIIAIMSVPSYEKTMRETEDNIRQCLQDNDSIKGDLIDEIVMNVGRSFSEADSTLDNKELLEACWAHNKLEIYRHTLYSTARVRNTTHPQGVRVGIGIFGKIFSTVCYSDLVLNLGPIRKKYNQRLIQDAVIPDNYIGDNPNLKPYHYKGNPDD